MNRYRFKQSRSSIPGVFSVISVVYRYVSIVYSLQSIVYISYGKERKKGRKTKGMVLRRTKSVFLFSAGQEKKNTVYPDHEENEEAKKEKNPSGSRIFHSHFDVQRIICRIQFCFFLSCLEVCVIKRRNFFSSFVHFEYPEAYVNNI